MPMQLPPKRLLLIKLLLLGVCCTPVAAMQSPWWENYDVKERYGCQKNGSLVLERNQSQASLISGANSLILFRDTQDNLGLTYRNESLKITLRGDELTLVQLPLRYTCQRIEET